MKRNVFVIFVSLFFSAGCGMTQQASFSPSLMDGSINNSFVYDPKGREEFIFHTKPASLQKFGYRNFCGNTRTFACQNRLPYNQYLGMRGFFDTSEPTKRDYYGYEFYPVILENGEKYYYVINGKNGTKFSAPIISYTSYLELQSFKPEPLIRNSPIQLLSKKIKYGKNYFNLSNGREISEKNLALVRDVSKRFGNSIEVAELLLEMKIDKDEVDFRYFISPIASSSKSDVQLYIGVNETREWLRFKVKYYDEDWVFARSLKVAADDYRWQSPELNFKRDHSSGSVWEWVDVPAKAKEIEVAKALAKAERATIRFQGSKYYSDKVLESEQKKYLDKTLKLFDLMKSQ